MITCGSIRASEGTAGSTEDRQLFSRFCYTVTTAVTTTPTQWCSFYFIPSLSTLSLALFQAPPFQYQTHCFPLHLCLLHSITFFHWAHQATCRTSEACRSLFEDRIQRMARRLFDSRCTLWRFLSDPHLCDECKHSAKSRDSGTTYDPRIKLSSHCSLHHFFFMLFTLCFGDIFEVILFLLVHFGLYAMCDVSYWKSWMEDEDFQVSPLHLTKDCLLTYTNIYQK